MQCPYSHSVHLFHLFRVPRLITFIIIMTVMYYYCCCCCCCYYYYHYGIFTSFLLAFQPMKDESGELPVLLVIDSSTFLKMWARRLLNLRNLRTSWYQLHSFREVFSQRSECSYDHRDDLGFHIPHPINFDL